MRNRKKAFHYLFPPLFIILAAACSLAFGLPYSHYHPTESSKARDTTAVEKPVPKTFEPSQSEFKSSSIPYSPPPYDRSPLLDPALPDQRLVDVSLTRPAPVLLSPSVPFTNSISAKEIGLPLKSVPAYPTTIGYSFDGHPILDYQIGSGDIRIILVGGIHGGYEWNTILLVYELLDYFKANPEALPNSVTLHVIPSANPDGQFAVTGTQGRFAAADVLNDPTIGRFNGRGVDLNRNWDCQWQPVGLWRGNEVSAGNRPFSEPETSALNEYFLRLQPSAVIFYHSAANGIFAGGCQDLHQPTRELAALYGEASGYPPYQQFYHYQVTGDASDWLSTVGIPSFSVELVDHQSIDWSKNLSGIQAVLDHFSAYGQLPQLPLDFHTSKEAQLR